MADRPLPDDVRRFLLGSGLRIPHVEAIVLLRRDPDASWSAHSLATRLYLPQPGASLVLEQLHALGIAATAAEPGHYRYLPSTPELADVLARLDQAYAADLVGITRLIHAAESSGAQAFADAFALRKEPR